MLFLYYLPILVGLLFAGVGLFFAFRRPSTGSTRINPAAEGQKRHLLLGRIVGGAVSLFGLGFASVFIVFSPSPSQRIAWINQCLHTARSEIVSIKLLPHPNPAYPSLVKSPVTITAPLDVDAIVHAISEARTFLPNHPHGIWYCRLQLQTQSARHDMVVGHSTSSENGTTISIMTEVDQGWNLGDFRSDELGPLLEAAARRVSGTNSASGT